MSGNPFFGALPTSRYSFLEALDFLTAAAPADSGGPSVQTEVGRLTEQFEKVQISPKRDRHDHLRRRHVIPHVRPGRLSHTLKDVLRNLIGPTPSIDYEALSSLRSDFPEAIYLEGKEGLPDLASILNSQIQQSTNPPMQLVNKLLEMLFLKNYHIQADELFNSLPDHLIDSRTCEIMINNLEMSKVCSFYDRYSRHLIGNFNVCEKLIEAFYIAAESDDSMKLKAVEVYRQIPADKELNPEVASYLVEIKDI